MANKKQKSEKKEVSIQEEKVINNESNDEVEILKAQLEDMKKQMEDLLKLQAQKPIVLEQKEKKEETRIGCRVLQGVGWGNPGDNLGEVRLRYNEEQNISVNDMKGFIRRDYAIKRLFEDGLCYFVDPKDYETFSIKKVTDLSDEALMNILSQKNDNKIISDLNELTNFKKKSNVLNCLIFRICDMIRNKKIDLDYYTRRALEEYFKFTFDRGINMLDSYEKIKTF